MKYSVELHLFTNSTIYAPQTEIIEATYESFKNTFDSNEEVPYRVWCDPNPYKEQSKKYIGNLKRVFGKRMVEHTNSLSDGYVRAVKESTADFMVMLEHDWEFQSERIDNTLEQILDEIDCNEDLLRVRFNRRRNEVKGTDQWLRETKGKHFTYCVTPSMSNNPHIIHRDRFIHRALPHVRIQKGAGGLENRLSKIEELKCALYGPMGHPRTVRHTNGRGEDRKKKGSNRK